MDVRKETVPEEYGGFVRDALKRLNDSMDLLTVGEIDVRDIILEKRLISFAPRNKQSRICDICKKDKNVQVDYGASSREYVSFAIGDINYHFQYTHPSFRE